MSADEDDYEVYPPIERVEIAKSHLLCASIFAALLIAGLFWLGYASQSRAMVSMALISGVAGYLSQLAGANFKWTGQWVWNSVMTGLIVTAAAAWAIGVIVYFL